MTIQYDGSYFSGWQIQNNQDTVQGLIESTLQKILKHPDRIKVHGAGRTDAGVHAKGQVAHAELNIRMKKKDIKNALNANLPNFCRIMDIERVNKDFHSRYNAISREYIYQCYTGNLILNNNQTWMVPELDIKLLNKLAKSFRGLNDFLSFSKFNKNIKNTDCLVFESYWLKHNDIYLYHIKANRFLHHMIRYLVGSMVSVSNKRMLISEFQTLLDQPKKEVKIFKAPARGLILDKINYEK